jgi:hypothetical protein
VTCRTAALLLLITVAVPSIAGAQRPTTDYRVLATSKTSTMLKEMQQAADAGYRFAAVMGGETSFGGSEVVVLMQKTGPAERRFAYRLLATSKTSTMQRELQDAADAGFEYIGQTVFQSMFGGSEVAVILERDSATPERRRYEYKLIATKKTSTLQKELQEAGQQGFEALGMTVGETASAGGELVVITRRPVG